MSAPIVARLLLAGYRAAAEPCSSGVIVAGRIGGSRQLTIEQADAVAALLGAPKCAAVQTSPTHRAWITTTPAGISVYGVLCAESSTAHAERSA